MRTPEYKQFHFGKCFLEFGLWRRNCNWLVQYHTGRGMFRLPHMPWEEWHSEGVFPSDAVKEALEIAGYRTEPVPTNFEGVTPNAGVRDWEVPNTWRRVLDRSPWPREESVYRGRDYEADTPEWERVLHRDEGPVGDES